MESSLQSPGAAGAPLDSERQVDVRTLLRVLRKRWPAVLIASGLVFGLAVVWTLRQPKIYESTCTLVIETSAPRVLNDVKDVVELGTGNYWANKEYYETQFRIIKSKEIAERVVERLGLRHDPDYVRPASDPQAPPTDPSKVDVAGAILAQVRVAGVKDSRIANITVADRKPDRAAALANAFAETYIEYNLDYKVSGSQKATTWLAEQARDLKEKLERSEMALYEFKSKNNLLAVSLDDNKSMTSQNLMAGNQQLNQIRARRIELEAARKIIAAAREHIEERETIPEIRHNTVIQGMKQMFAQLSREKADLSSRYGDRHPKIATINEQIATLNREYQVEIDGILAASEKQFQQVLDAEKSLNALIEKEKRQAIELSKLEAMYKPLAREAENNAKVYGLITQRQKEIDLTGVLKTGNVRVLDPAVAIGVPVKPRVILSMFAGLACGLLFGVALAFGLEAIDRTLKTHEDVERIVAVPVLGVVPVIGEKKEAQDRSAIRERDLHVHRNPKSTAAEFCRSIRTNLMFLSPDSPIRTLVITSPSPQEGKTTTAVSMGITMAQAGARVLIVDTDMRRPRLHHSFAMSNDVGVSNLIVGNSSIEKSVRQTEVPNLDVLTCGPTPPNPAELLLTERFRNLVKDLAARYDRVIFDSPPTSAVTDPAVLGNLMDGVLLVVRGGKSTRESALHARRQLLAANANLLGVVINEVDFSSRTYGSYYYRTYSTYGRYYQSAEPEASA